MTALCCVVKHLRCLNYSTATAVSMLVLNIKILYYFCAAALEEGSEEWETKGMRCEEKEPGERSERDGKGKGRYGKFCGP